MNKADSYKAAILKKYISLLDSGKLSTKLVDPTPSNLKNEVIKQCQVKTDDEGVCRSFIDKGKLEGTIIDELSRLDIDKFRPLQQFLKEKTSKPNLKVVELAAWLIDFQSRPFSKWESNEDGDTGGGIEPLSGFWTRQKLSVLVVVGLVGLLCWKICDKPCMYWTGTHYEKTVCSIELGDTVLIALNSERFEKLKRITKPDTITYQSIGKVWYAKPIADSADFYTSGGEHPSDNGKVLKPITKYIIDKYVLKL